MRTTEVSYESADGTSAVHALLWLPEDAAPRGIVQIVHGMAEHAGRYGRFAEYLTGRGFIVCANDHVGHGKTVSDARDLGHIPLRGADEDGACATGKDILVQDVHALRERIQAEFPGTPHVMFGHSMGSFIVRSYIARHGQGLAAAVLCGTGQQPRALSLAGNAASRLLGCMFGPRHKSRFVHSLGAGSFAGRIRDAKTPFDWISADEEVVRAFSADPLCGQMFSVGGYAALTSLTAEVVRPRSARAVPRDLPLLFIAGEGDPVGDFGRGVRKAAKEYRDAGVAHVDEILYPGMRHEILNEAGRARVYADVESWLAAVGL